MDNSEQRAKNEREHASLVVRVADRDALPVRAIPYVSGWTISPDVVAKNFARGQPSPFAKLQNTDTFHLVDGRPVKLLPKEWDRYVAGLQGLEAELRDQFANDERGYAAWVARSVAKLPQGVFVWLDDFTADFALNYGPDRLSIMDEREGDRELNLSPFLENETLNMVLDGFGARDPLPNYSGDDTIASIGEMVYNGRLIDWRYWVENMPKLSPAEAARLMSGLDPDLYEDLTARPVPKNDPSRACAEARRIERLATVQGISQLTPDEWYLWALENGFGVHRGFFLAARGRHLVEREDEVLKAMPRAEAVRWECAPVTARGERQVSTSFAGHTGTSVLTFPEFCAELDERLARWRLGRYELVEAAEVLAQSAALDAGKLARQMDAAIHAGKLAYRVNNIRVDGDYVPQKHLWHQTLFDVDVNKWLAAESIGADLQLRFPYPDAPSSPEPEALPEAEGPVLGAKPSRPEASTIQHRIKSRSDQLAAVLERAKEAALDRDDYLSVWAALVSMAQSSSRPAPLLGYVEDEGVKYQVAEGLGTKFLTKNALRKRLNPASRGR